MNIQDWPIIPGYVCANCGSPARQDPADCRHWGCAQCNGASHSVALNFVPIHGVRPTEAPVAKADELSPMQKVRDHLVAVIDQHEAQAHAGEACGLERLNAVAYLSHALGIKPEHLGKIGERITEYDLLCPCRESRRALRWLEHPGGN